IAVADEVRGVGTAPCEFQASINPSLALVRRKVTSGPRSQGCESAGFHVRPKSDETRSLYCRSVSAVLSIDHTVPALGSIATGSLPRLLSVHVFPPSWVVNRPGSNAHPSLALANRSLLIRLSTPP